MSENSPTYSDDSLLQPLSFSINSSFLPFELHCILLKSSSSLMTAFNVTNMLLHLPLCIIIFYHGFQRCRQERSSTAGVMSLSDNLTYHMVTVQLINVFGSILCCCGIYRHDIPMLILWYYLLSFTWYGETYFHVLTCVEPYMAVVYPITYLSLRKERWVRIRNIITGCVWLLSFGWAALNIKETVPIIVDLSFLISAVGIISFCSLSVLYVLIHPGPGKQGRCRMRVDQSKQRAFYTIMAVLGMLLLRFTWNLAWFVQDHLYGGINHCAWVLSDGWITLPSSLVLPLMFLQRAGLLLCCKSDR